MIDFSPADLTLTDMLEVFMPKEKDWRANEFSEDFDLKTLKNTCKITNKFTLGIYFCVLPMKYSIIVNFLFKREMF